MKLDLLEASIGDTLRAAGSWEEESTVICPEQLLITVLDLGMADFSLELERCRFLVDTLISDSVLTPSVELFLCKMGFVIIWKNLEYELFRCQGTDWLTGVIIL